MKGVKKGTENRGMRLRTVASQLSGMIPLKAITRLLRHPLSLISFNRPATGFVNINPVDSLEWKPYR